MSYVPFGPQYGGPAFLSEWLFVDPTRDDVLYRALLDVDAFVLTIADNCSFFPEHRVLDETKNVRGHECQLIEVERFPFQIGIQELPRSRVLDCVRFLVELVQHSFRFQAVPADIHEGNVLWWGRPYWVDWDAFRPATPRWASQSFVLISYLLQRYFLRANTPLCHEDFDMRQLAEFGGWTAQQSDRDFTDTTVWSEFHAYVSSLHPPEAPHTHWSDEYGTALLTAAERVANPKFSALLALVPTGRTLLDVGCNLGYTCLMLRDRFDHVLGVDVDERCVELAQRQTPDLETNFACFGIEHLMRDVNGHPILARYQADVVLALALVHHLEKLGLSVSDVGRVLVGLTRQYLVIEDIVQQGAYEAALKANGLALERRVQSYPSGRTLSLWRRVGEMSFELQLKPTEVPMAEPVMSVQPMSAKPAQSFVDEAATLPAPKPAAVVRRRTSIRARQKAVKIRSRK